MKSLGNNNPNRLNNNPITIEPKQTLHLLYKRK